METYAYKHVHLRSVFYSVLVFVSFLFYSFPLLRISSLNMVLFSHSENRLLIYSLSGFPKRTG